MRAWRRACFELDSSLAPGFSLWSPDLAWLTDKEICMAFTVDLKKLLTALLIVMVSLPLIPQMEAEAKPRKSVSRPSVKAKRTIKSKKRAARSKRAYAARKKTAIASSRKRSASQGRKHAARGRHLIMSGPEFDTSPLSVAASKVVKSRFARGDAGGHSPEDLVRAGVFTHYPLKGGIFNRNSDIKHIIVHSTETARPADGPRVIRSWNNRGRSHPGTQYVVDRNGVIYQTVVPTYGTMHVNSARTLKGVNNDNSIGIEIVRAGKQKYTGIQLEKVARLVDYLKDRYKIDKVYGHGQIQPSTRTDPVAFDWKSFNQRLAVLDKPGLNPAFASGLPSALQMADEIERTAETAEATGSDRSQPDEESVDQHEAAADWDDDEAKKAAGKSADARLAHAGEFAASKALNDPQYIALLMIASVIQSILVFTANGAG